MRNGRRSIPSASWLVKILNGDLLTRPVMQQLPKAKNSPWTAVLGWVLLVSSSVIVAQPGFNQSSNFWILLKGLAGAESRS